MLVALPLALPLLAALLPAQVPRLVALAPVEVLVVPGVLRPVPTASTLATCRGTYVTWVGGRSW